MKTIIFILTLAFFHSNSVLANTVSVDIDGYYEVCLQHPAIYKQQGKEWVQALTKLSSSGMYYLDNKFVGYGMCDNVVCQKVDKPLNIPLIEYKDVGSKKVENLQGVTGTVKLYQSSPITGPIKIVINYFSDDKCKVPQTFTKEMDAR